MKQNWKAIGIAVVAAGLLVYPAMKLIQMIARRKEEAEGKDDTSDHHMKAFVPAYRGKHKPHHRHEHNGKTGLQ
jgi:hypothetical protein